MKPLKILLGNNTLALLAGSETYTYTLAQQLKKMGHHVSCFSPELGIISDELRKEGIRSFSEISTSRVRRFTPFLEEPVSHDYDIIIASHFHIVAYLREKFPRTPIVNIIHGPLHILPDGSWAPEHPATESGVNHFVAVSEEMQERLKIEYGIDSTVIRNAIDIKKFGALRPANEKPKTFLVNTNYHDRNDPVIQVIKEAAKHYDARVAAIGVNFAPTLDVAKAVEESDVVFARGRSVLEGAAAGRLCIVHGLWGTGGVMAESTIDEIRQCNFSGRNARGYFATKEDLIALIDKYYTPSILDWTKEYTAREHNIVFAAEKFLKIAYDLTGAAINAPAQNSGVASDARPLKRAF